MRSSSRGVVSTFITARTLAYAVRNDPRCLFGVQMMRRRRLISLPSSNAQVTRSGSLP